MSSFSKSFAILLIVLFLMPLVTLQPVTVKAQSSNLQAPAIQWGEEYKSTISEGTEYVSNLIQTSDGGYAFMDLGWSYEGILVPSTIYKVDSTGSSVQWEKTINFFQGSAIIQTSDGGYEVSGYWNGYEGTPTLIKMDSQGNIQWSENYSSVPSLGIVSSEIQGGPFAYWTDGNFQTSDGGFVYWTQGSITKTDSNNNTQWVKNLVYPVGGTVPLGVFSVIETSDGSLAILGVGYEELVNPRLGNIYYLRTSIFLPSPSPTQLPTPLPTATPTPIPTATTTVSKPVSASSLTIAIVLILTVVVIVIIFLLLYMRKRKPINSSK